MNKAPKITTGQPSTERPRLSYDPRDVISLTDQRRWAIRDLRAFEQRYASSRALADVCTRVRDLADQLEAER
jgi:hypothetical protein